jgi:hypothetical protein
LAELISTDTHSLSLEITIAVRLQLFFKQTEIIFLFRTIRIAEELSLNE